MKRVMSRILQAHICLAAVTTIRNRVVGILLGILVTSVVFYNLWPERQAGGENTVAG